MITGASEAGIEHANREYYYQYMISAVVAFAVAKVIDALPASSLENMHLDAMYMRFAMSFIQLTALSVFGLGSAQLLGLQVDNILGHLLTSASVVIGLASQSTLSNIAAGIQLIFTRPFHVGDHVCIADVQGVVTEVDFFHMRILTDMNEGVNIPNSVVLSGALHNHSWHYSRSAACLRAVAIRVRVSMNADFDKAIAALDKAAKEMDQHMEKINSDSTVKSYRTGTHTLAEYHQKKYGKNLHEEQKNNPASVFIAGPHAIQAAHCFDLIVYCDSTLAASVKQHGYRCAIKQLTEAGLQLS